MKILMCDKQGTCPYLIIAGLLCSIKIISLTLTRKDLRDPFIMELKSIENDISSILLLTAQIIILITTIAITCDSKGQRIVPRVIVTCNKNSN